MAYQRSTYWNRYDPSTHNDMNGGPMEDIPTWGADPTSPFSGDVGLPPIRRPIPDGPIPNRTPNQPSNYDPISQHQARLAASQQMRGVADQRRGAIQPQAQQAMAMLQQLKAPSSKGGTQMPPNVAIQPQGKNPNMQMPRTQPSRRVMPNRPSSNIVNMLRGNQNG